MIEQPDIPTPAQVLAHELRASPRTAPETSGAGAGSGLGKATHQGAPVPWDVLPLLRYIADPKAYNEESGFECDTEWAQSRARFILQEHARFHGQNSQPSGR
jgi:hypothetical protein